MPYTIDFSNITKDPIIVEDNTVESTRTSLDIPGRNTTGYGTIVGQNFIKLLENFANGSPPRTPVEGQLWFDSNSKRLLVSDSTADAGASNNNWRPASGVYTQETEPLNALTGDLWVDTDSQRMYLYTGSTWILVGPEFSDGLSTGAKAQTILGTDNIAYTVLTLEVEGKPALIVSSNDFIPKTTLNGFSSIKPGLNVATNNLSGQGLLSLVGTADNAKALLVGSTSVNASNFLRSDISTTANFLFKVKNDDGIRVGSADSASLTVEANNATLTNRIEGAAIDFKVNDGSYTTALRISGSKNIGIQKLNPDYELDVRGTIRSEENILIDGLTNSTGTDTGSLITKGGLGVGLNANIGADLKVFGDIVVVNNIIPDGVTNTIGTTTNPFNDVYSDRFHGVLYGRLEGSLSGNVFGKATQLASVTKFQLSGDVTSPQIEFDGKTGTSLKTFETTIDPGFISSKTTVENGILLENDEFIINRINNNEGLLKVSKSSLLRSIPQLPVGTIMPFAGSTLPDPRLYGGYWLLCDGSLYTEEEFADLYLIIGDTYDTTVLPGTFRVPDLRGRMPVGLDNMGGNSANRISTDADQIGYFGGNDTVELRDDQIPDHKHDLVSDENNNKPYYAVRQAEEAAVNGSIPWKAGDAANTSAVAITGGILDYPGQQPINIMNPFMALNYIIWTGKEL